MSQRQDYSSDKDDVLDLRKIFELIVKKLWIPFTTTLICIAAGIAYVKLAEPVYEAKATVEVLINNRNLAGMEVQGMNLGSDEALATTAANLQRTSLFQKVMEREEVSHNPNLGLSEIEGSLKRALQMVDWTTVKLRRGSRLIDITVKHADPEIARLLATAIVEEYLRERELIESGTSKSAFEMLVVEKREIDGRLEQLEADQQSIEKTLTARTEIQTLEAEIEVLLQTKGLLHPDVKTLNTKLAGMFDDLEILVGNARQLIAKETANSSADEGKSPQGSREERLIHEVDQLELVQLSLLRDIESERALGEVIVGRLKEAEITIDIQTIPLALVEPAFAADEPVSPQPIKILAAATVLGGGMGLFVIGVFYVLDGTFCSVAEAERATGLPVLGAIPYDKRLPDQAWLKNRSDRNLAVHLHDTGSPGSGGGVSKTAAKGKQKIEPIVLLSDPGSPVAESFRTLRATLDLRAGDDACKTFLVISSAPNEGKSFVAANLAVAMAAQSEQKILLIDADLRCPSMQVIFDLESDSGGLGEALLDGNGDLDGLILSTAIANLNILPAGHQARNPAELLSSPALAILLERFTAVYDRIVIDVAPINAVADGLLLAPLADSLLLVARAGRTHRDTVNHSIQTLIEAGSPADGLVLNHISAPKRGSSKINGVFQRYGDNYRESYG